MRSIGILLGGAALFAASPASAADALKFGPPPAWVTPEPIPQAKPTDAPVLVLLSNSQIAMEQGKIVTFGEAAIKIQNPQGLAAGNISLSWQPETETITVNKLQIRRGDKVIDVLAAGQTFTVLRRETNLDAATLDGTLTANIQPEGLQEGDIIEFASTTERSDPVLKGHVEAMFGSWNASPIESAYTKLVWPNGLKLNVRKSASLPEPKKSSRDGKNVFELSATHLEPVLPPSGAPARFRVGRLIEATDYSSWADIADLMAPLFRTASVIPATGPLHDEVERIRTASNDPKRRTEMALALAQDRVRYVALLMGQGSYVPAQAETTWSRRFGDCKAKTALLLAILHALDIEAEPVLVQSRVGDMIGERLPMIALFDHVLVRAHIAGKAYWLDGTRAGDTSLDDIQVPDFSWGLPIVRNAQLVRIVPPPLDVATNDNRIDIDARSGVHVPATVTINETYKGDAAVELNRLYASLATARRDEALRDGAKRYLDTISVTGSTMQFDKAMRQLDVTIKGTAKLEWKDGWFRVPTSSIAFNPDFDRTAGPNHDAPFTVVHPRYVKETATIHLPAGFAAEQELSSPVRETVAGVEYVRTEKVDGDVLIVDSSERSVVSEVAYKDAIAAKERLRALDQDDVYLRMADNYKPTDEELAALAGSTPANASEYLKRGNLYLDRWKLDEAISDYSKAIELDPKNEWALADRSLAYVWKNDHASAEKDAAAVERLNAKNPVLWRARGLSAQNKGDCKAAVAAFSKSLEVEPGSDFAHGRRALCEHRLGQDEQALADSALALKGDKSWLELRSLRANILLSQGKRDSVAAEIDQLVQDNPQSDVAWVMAGKVYAQIGMQAKAMTAFDRALAIKPQPYAYINRARARAETDRSGRTSDLEAALKLKPDDVDTMAEVASEYAQQGDFARSLAIYDRLVVPTPGFSSYAVLRAAVLQKIGRTSEAAKILTAQRAKAKTAKDLNNLCWTKATNGIMLESALQDCRDALKLSPDSGQYLDSLGMALLKLGKLDEALAAYDQAIAKRTIAESLMGRAFVYERKGDKARAAVDRADALKLDPDTDARFTEYGLKF